MAQAWVVGSPGTSEGQGKGPTSHCLCEGGGPNKVDRPLPHICRTLLPYSHVQAGITALSAARLGGHSNVVALLEVRG